MKKYLLFICVVILFGIKVEAKEKPEELYAQSAVLMDADTGRVLFEKNSESVKAMASTTKIMTCILALEHTPLNEVVTFSKNATIQPAVHLKASEGEQFYMEDMLYALMLESYNDVAVAVAETVAGSEVEFARMMNQKAKEIGCENTYFITANGLDAEDEVGFHSTTAKDLAKIMSYCVMDSPQKEKFLEITSRENYSFSNIARSKQYYCVNYNSYLSMNSEAISGKTGYTSKAGYCYVGAVESKGRTFVVALLACGWPNHKNYKWSDMKEMIAYAVEEYQLQQLPDEINQNIVLVRNGKSETGLYGKAEVEVVIENDEDEILLGDSEVLELEIELSEEIEAPVENGEVLGSAIYRIDGEVVAEYPVVSTKSVKRIDFYWIFSKMIELYLK